MPFPTPTLNSRAAALLAVLALGGGAGAIAGCGGSSSRATPRRPRSRRADGETNPNVDNPGDHRREQRGRPGLDRRARLDHHARRDVDRPRRLALGHADVDRQDDHDAAGHRRQRRARRQRQRRHVRRRRRRRRPAPTDRRRRRRRPRGPAAPVRRPGPRLQARHRPRPGRPAVRAGRRAGRATTRARRARSAHRCGARPASQVGPAVRPVVGLLELGGEREQRALLRGLADELDAERQAVVALVERQRDRRLAADVAAAA